VLTAELEIQETIENKNNQWSSKQKRCYHRLRSMLTYWESHDFEMLVVTLTSSPASNAIKLRDNHDRLRMSIEYNFGYKDIEHFIVETKEGYGVLHIVWALKSGQGLVPNNFYVPQDWLSSEWYRLHKANIVYIKRYDNVSGSSPMKLSKYFVSQYYAGQQDFVRYSYSWRRTLGFPLVRYWTLFKDYWLNHAQVDYKEMLWLWDMFLRGERLPDVLNKGKFFYTIDEMKHIQI